MTYRGEIHNGTVVLDELVPLPEGSRVECIVLPLPEVAPTSGLTEQSAAFPSDDRPVWERIASVAEALPEDALAGLPEDGAAQLDHYLYGSQKRVS